MPPVPIHTWWPTRVQSATVVHRVCGVCWSNGSPWRNLTLSNVLHIGATAHTEQPTWMSLGMDDDTHIWEFMIINRHMRACAELKILRSSMFAFARQSNHRYVDRSWYHVILWMQWVSHHVHAHYHTKKIDWCFHYLSKIVFTFAHLNSHNFRCMSWPSNISLQICLPAESLLEILNQSASEVSICCKLSPRCWYSTYGL